MSIVRVAKNSNYVVMNRTALNDKRLSWKAKGIMAYLLSMPDDWVFYMDELVTHAKDGRDSFRSGFKELKDAGYVERRAIKDEKTKKIISWETIVHEIPMEPVTEKPHTDIPQMGNPEVEKPLVENPTLLSTDNNQVLNKPNTDIDQRLTDIDTDIYKDIDKEGRSSVMVHPYFDSIKQAFESTIRIATVQDCNHINEALDYYEPSLILKALEAGKNSARSFKYILSILDNWRKELGIKTYQDWIQKIQSKGGQSNASSREQHISTTDDAKARVQRETERLKKLLQNKGH